MLRKVNVYDEAPCMSRGADLDWWIERDIDPADFPDQPDHLTGGPNVRSLDGPFGEAYATMTRALVRGKILCYSCPLFVECRNRSWDEPAHVFAGLDWSERFNIRTSQALLLPNNGAFETKGPTRNRVRELFIAGRDVGDIAETLSRNETTVWWHIKGALAEVRAAREEEEAWQLDPIPGLQQDTNRRRFRRGRDNSSFFVEAATTAQPIPDDSSEEIWA